jgi:hypothetical protein
VAQIESVFVPLPPEHVERAWEESGDGRAFISADEASGASQRDFVSVIPAQGGSVLVSCWSGRGAALKARLLDLLHRDRRTPALAAVLTAGPGASSESRPE